MLKLISLFRAAGATGHVFFLRKGKVTDKGIAYSGLVWPTTTIAVVPTTPQVVPFSINAQTKDKQRVVVNGTITATLTPSKAVSRFDFTVDLGSRGYVSNWAETLKAKVIERVLRTVLAEVANLAVEEATRSQKIVEDAVTAALGVGAFANDGITVDSCSIPVINPRDEAVGEAIGAQERQAMLATADAAVHGRQMDAATNDRKLKEYEAGTRIELEKKQADLLLEREKNSRKEASIDAAATTIRLAPLADVDAGKLLGAAIMEAAKSGRMGSLAITSEFLAAIGQK